MRTFLLLLSLFLIRLCLQVRVFATQGARSRKLIRTSKMSTKKMIHWLTRLSMTSGKVIPTSSTKSVNQVSKARNRGKATSPLLQFQLLEFKVLKNTYQVALISEKEYRDP